MTTQLSRRPAGTTTPAGPPPLTPQQAAWIRSELASGRVTVYQGDCLNVLHTLPDASVDAVVTDPPYELAFMGRAWDASGIAFNTAVWAECLRVLKPGGHLLAFGGTRTYHRLAVAIEDAGFEIRDSLHWIYGNGFPKSKAIDARDGWGTALKPAHEAVVLARAPLAGTVAETVTTYGTGALNIDGCRVPPTGESRPRVGEASQDRRYTDRGGTNLAALPGVRGGDPAGRWPTNVVLSHPPVLADGEPVGDACADGCVPGCPVADLDRQSGERRGGGRIRHGTNASLYEYGSPRRTPFAGYSDTGGASRFFPVFRYEAKAPSSERPRLPDGTAHPTVKPVALMRWLVRLVTPPGGVILDPFAGSGTTGEAALAEGFRAVLIEREEPYAELIRRRLDRPIQSALDLGEAL